MKKVEGLCYFLNHKKNPLTLGIENNVYIRYVHMYSPSECFCVPY